jgi:hypothetical protein
LLVKTMISLQEFHLPLGGGQEMHASTTTLVPRTRHATPWGGWHLSPRRAPDCPLGARAARLDLSGWGRRLSAYAALIVGQVVALCWAGLLTLLDPVGGWRAGPGDAGR